jgi:NAD(P)H-dependent flavin oxidoreductase YrpB (nitropropane dioxygenase family)
MFDTLNSKYPIIAAAMNQVSDLNLAIACSNAGIVASISSFNYINDDVFRFDLLSRDLLEFTATTKSKNLILSTSMSMLTIKEMRNILDERNFGAIEISDWNPYSIQLLSAFDIPIILKTNGGHYYEQIKDSVIDLVDAIVIKGPLGAGLVNVNAPLRETFLKLKENHKELTIIPSGGISSSNDVCEFLNLGAEYVAIGTLFAACTESRISIEAKQKIIHSSNKDIKFLDNSTQNAIYFGPINEPDNYNNTQSLQHGITNAKSGHIFAGAAINNITEIESVNTVVQRLVKNLNL